MANHTTTISLRYQIAQKVRNWRLKRGYTQRDLAEKIGVTYQIVLQYEKGTRKISIGKLYAMAEVLSINIKDLHTESIKIGLQMNYNKTKIMTNQQEEIRITVAQTKIEQVMEYIYLG